MRVRHPYALEDGPPAPDARVHYGGRRETATVNADGVFEAPDSARSRLESWAAGYGYDLDALLVDGGSDAETYRCGVNDCRREVEGPDAVCWQHRED